MQNKSITIINKLGLHARAAAKFVQTAAKFDCDINITHNGKKVNGKSIMGIMMLAASKGSTIEIVATGKDEKIALASLEQLIRERFGEEE
jgi:phosphocarrier protein HPr